ncbi:hypothetical protein FB446DRAFT_772784 [Lentinula raphanica]|nr:hypothetical protein FB446DRAFT_772784 [Lentinula raphanica]
MFNTSSPYFNDSTESLIETRYLSASGRDSAPASPMSSTFFDHPDILARSISPVPSNYAVYARSRPTSTDSSFLDFQAFSPSRLQLATAANNSSLMEKVAEQLRQVDDKDKESQASSPVSDKASLASKQTTRSRMVRRSDPVEPIVEGDQVESVAVSDAKAQEGLGQVEKKKSKRFLPKFFRRALSTSGALNAQILDRSTAPSKPGPGPRPLASSTRANTSPAAFDTASISTSKTKVKSPSLFRFKHKPEPTGKSPTESTTPAIPSPPSPGSPAPLTAEIIQRRRQVRRSGSFAGFSSSGFAAAAARPKSPVVFDSYAHHPHMGVTTNEDNFEDELDALTLEAAALSAQIGRRWLYAEDRI